MAGVCLLHFRPTKTTPATKRAALQHIIALVPTQKPSQFHGAYYDDFGALFCL